MTLKSLLLQMEWIGGYCSYCAKLQGDGHSKTCRLARWIKVLSKVGVVPSIQADLKWLEENIKLGTYDNE